MTVKGTIQKLKKLFQKVQSWKDAIDGFLTSYKWILTLAGIISTSIHFFTAHKIVTQGTEIQQKADTIKSNKIIIQRKTDTIKLAATVCSKSVDDDPDTAKKYRKLAKVFYMKRIEINGSRERADSDLRMITSPACAMPSK